MSAVLKPTPQREKEIQLIDQALEAWAVWTRSSGVNLKMQMAGDVLGIKRQYEARYLLALTDDEMLVLDQGIARLPERLQQVVRVEYFNEGGAEGKARRLGLGRTAYQQRVEGARWALYGSLQAHVQRWVAMTGGRALKPAR